MRREPVIFCEPVDVEAALLCDALVPPSQPESLKSGPTADLRNAMARFSGPQLHGGRRAAVDKEIAAIGSHPFASEAHRRTAQIIQRFRSDDIEAANDLAFVVPGETMAGALGIAEEQQEQVRKDVFEIANVIGRGHRSTPTSDHSATRLARLFGDGKNGHVAPMSLLYQTHDATAALFISVLLADEANSRRRPAVAATARTVKTAVTIGGVQLQAEDAIVIDLESPRFEFGLGPHGCPGQSIANRIVAGMVQAVRDAGLRVNIDAVGRGPDGRAHCVPLRS